MIMRVFGFGKPTEKWGAEAEVSKITLESIEKQCRHSLHSLRDEMSKFRELIHAYSEYLDLFGVGDRAFLNKNEEELYTSATNLLYLVMGYAVHRYKGYKSEAAKELVDAFAPCLKGHDLYREIALSDENEVKIDKINEACSELYSFLVRSKYLSHYRRYSTESLIASHDRLYSMSSLGYGNRYFEGFVYWAYTPENQKVLDKMLRTGSGMKTYLPFSPNIKYYFYSKTASGKITDPHELYALKQLHNELVYDYKPFSSTLLSSVYSSSSIYFDYLLEYLENPKEFDWDRTAEELQYYVGKFVPASKWKEVFDKVLDRRIWTKPLVTQVAQVIYIVPEQVTEKEVDWLSRLVHNCMRQTGGLATDLLISSEDGVC